MDIDLNEIWEAYEEVKYPSREEICTIAKTYLDLFLKCDELTTEYIELQRLYKFLFGIYFVSKSSIWKVEEELEKRGHHRIPSEEMDYFQKNDGLGLNFIYLRSWTHIERLTESEKDVLKECLQNPSNESLFLNALEMIDKTYYKVLAVAPEKPEQWFELFPSIHGEGRVKGKKMVFSIKTEIQEDEAHKRAALFNVIRQLETILSEVLNAEVLFVGE